MVWKYSPIFYFNSAPFGAFFLPFLGSMGLFFGLRSGSNTLLRPTNVDNLLQSYISFFILLHLKPFFLLFLGSTGLFFGLRSGSKTLLRPTNVDNLLQSYISFLILLHLEPLMPFADAAFLFQTIFKVVVTIRVLRLQS